MKELRKAEFLAVDTETTDVQPMLAALVGISLCAQPGMAYYIPIRHACGDLEALMSGTAEPEVTFTPDKALAAVKPLLEDPGIRKTGHNIKYDMIVLAGRHRTAYAWTP